MPQMRRLGNAGDVPERGNPDRSRVLNIMAQRRYRQRQREKLRNIPSQSPQAGVSSWPTANRSDSIQFVQPQPLHSSNTESCKESFINASDLDLVSYNFGSDLSTLDCDSMLKVYDFENIISSDSSESNQFMISASDANSPFHCETPDFNSELASLEISQYTFPDDSQFEIPVLKVLKVGLTIAQLLVCADSIWDPTAIRTLDKDLLPGKGSSLPPNLLPTTAQKRFPHHPIIDILPWPSVRTTLLCVFAQPPQFRPPIARDPEALMQLYYDLDDDIEGVRIVDTGTDTAAALDQKNWEVGQKFFRNWWWALDKGVISNSNSLRKRRGATPLTLMPL